LPEKQDRDCQTHFPASNTKETQHRERQQEGHQFTQFVKIFATLLFSLWILQNSEVFPYGLYSKLLHLPSPRIYSTVTENARIEHWNVEKVTLTT
jgi:hypothetical protein